MLHVVAVYLATQPVSWCDPSDSADIIVLRKCAKNVLFTVANSNAMNYDIIGYSMPLWELALIIVDCAVAAGIVVWGFFAVRKFVKGRKALSTGSTEQSDLPTREE